MELRVGRPPNPKVEGRIRDYVKIEHMYLPHEPNDKRVVSGIMVVLYTNNKGNTYYSKADANTQAVICGHLDKYRQINRVTPPNGYIRNDKWVRRDLIVQRSQTSTHGPMHKSEKSTCPLNICADRTGNCNCMCRQCFRSTEVCRCCKRCSKEEHQCMCCEHCENLVCVCVPCVGCGYKENECECAFV